MKLSDLLGVTELRGIRTQALSPQSLITLIFSAESRFRRRKRVPSAAGVGRGNVGDVEKAERGVPGQRRGLA